MHKFIAIGDIHAEYDLFWEALRAASCVTPEGLPTPPVCSGMYQVVLIGDLVHPKSWGAYARLIGEDYDLRNQTHLLSAAKRQIEGLRRIKAYQEAAPHSVHLILGNHDSNVLDTQHVLGTGGGLRHIEFDPQHGGVHLPADLREWISGFVREVRVGRLQFAHVSPLPAHQVYDDLFYADKSAKRWFRETPAYVQMAGLQFGVYGHTQSEGGIAIHRDAKGRPLLAIIDALQWREYLEIVYDEEQEYPLRSVTVVPF